LAGFALRYKGRLGQNPMFVSGFPFPSSPSPFSGKPDTQVRMFSTFKDQSTNIRLAKIISNVTGQTCLGYQSHSASIKHRNPSQAQSQTIHNKLKVKTLQKTPINVKNAQK